HIIHDWNDEDSRKILESCRKAMKPGASVIVVEKAIPEGNEPEFAKILDINMLAIGGKERTLEQYEKLFASAGLKLHRHVKTPGPIDLIEAKA
ncbi:MAG: methyltransferase, partial [Planctomycetota bacterium]